MINDTFCTFFIKLTASGKKITCTLKMDLIENAGSIPNLSDCTLLCLSSFKVQLSQKIERCKNESSLLLAKAEEVD